MLLPSVSSLLAAGIGWLCLPGSLLLVNAADAQSLSSNSGTAAPVAAPPRQRPLRFDVEASSEHFSNRGACVEWKVPGQSLVTGSVSIQNPHDNVRANVLIYDNYGNQPFSQPDLRGETRFSFRSLETAAPYQVCVRALPKSGATVAPGSLINVEIIFAWTFDLFDDRLAQEYKIKPIESEFIQLEASMSRLAAELELFVQNEEALRDTNESTLDRVRVFAVGSMLVLVGLGLYQIFYLKRYFRAKKLI